jgi:hypothetical protein
MPDLSNAEWEIAVTESGRVRVLSIAQRPKGQSGIVVSRDGVANIRELKLVHPSQTPDPRVETEEGTVKDVRSSQLRNARESIL